MIKLTRALSRSANPSPDEASLAWDKVAFTNYVPVTVGYGAKSRPTREAWKQAEAEWGQVLDLVSPKLVIVLGLTMWSRMPHTQVVLSHRVQGYRLNNGNVAMCHAVRHPSYGPDWEWYSNFIAETAKGLI